MIYRWTSIFRFGRVAGRQGGCAAGPSRLSAGGGVGYREGRSGRAVVDERVVLTELLVLDDLVEVD